MKIEVEYNHSTGNTYYIKDFDKYCVYSVSTFEKTNDLIVQKTGPIKKHLLGLNAKVLMCIEYLNRITIYECNL